MGSRGCLAGIAVVIAAVWITWETAVVRKYVCHDGQMRQDLFPCDADLRENGYCVFNSPAGSWRSFNVVVEVGGEKSGQVRGWPVRFLCMPLLPMVESKD